MSKDPNHQEEFGFLILKELREMRSDVVNNHEMLAEHSECLFQINKRLKRIEKFLNVILDVLADGQNQILSRQGTIVYIDKKKGFILKPEIDFREAA